jgi:hypothetical protein
MNLNGSIAVFMLRSIKSYRLNGSGGSVPESGVASGNSAMYEKYPERMRGICGD